MGDVLTWFGDFLQTFLDGYGILWLSIVVTILAIGFGLLAGVGFKGNIKGLGIVGLILCLLFSFAAILLWATFIYLGGLIALLISIELGHLIGILACLTLMTAASIFLSVVFLKKGYKGAGIFCIVLAVILINIIEFISIIYFGHIK